MSCLNILEINALLFASLKNIFSSSEMVFLLKNVYSSVYLAMADLINCGGMWDLYCIMWDISLQCGLSSCMWAQLPPACEIIVPQPGIEPTSPALTTGPPGIKKVLLQFMSRSVLPMFSSKSFILFGLKFRCLKHLSLFFCMVLENVLIYFFFSCGSPVSQHHLMKRLSLLHCIFLLSLS